MMVERGEKARQRLIECNLRFVISQAKRFRHCGLPFSDLVQEGNIGLMEAVDRYDLRRGVRFLTYAGWWIQQAMRRAAAEQSRVIRLPMWVNDELYRLRKARDDLESRLGRQPTLRELADQMGFSLPKTRQLVKWSLEVLSLEMPVGDIGTSSLADFIEDDDTPAVEEVIVHHQLRKEVQAAVDMHLEPRDREVLHMRYALNGGEGRTLEEIARVRSHARACPSA